MADGTGNGDGTELGTLALDPPASSPRGAAREATSRADEAASDDGMLLEGATHRVDPLVNARRVARQPHPADHTSSPRAAVAWTARKTWWIRCRAALLAVLVCTFAFALWGLTDQARRGRAHDYALVLAATVFGAALLTIAVCTRTIDHAICDELIENRVGVIRGFASVACSAVVASAIASAAGAPPLVRWAMVTLAVVSEVTAVMSEIAAFRSAAAQRRPWMYPDGAFAHSSGGCLQAANTARTWLAAHALANVVLVPWLLATTGVGDGTFQPLAVVELIYSVATSVRLCANMVVVHCTPPYGKATREEYSLHYDTYASLSQAVMVLRLCALCAIDSEIVSRK
jgi:hypothetical protein